MARFFYAKKMACSDTDTVGIKNYRRYLTLQTVCWLWTYGKENKKKSVEV
jgi:hypothetical protein